MGSHEDRRADARPETKSARPKLTAEQRRAIKSLMVDSGYSRAEAVAWVTTFGTEVL